MPLAPERAAASPGSRRGARPRRPRGPRASPSPPRAPRRRRPRRRKGRRRWGCFQNPDRDPRRRGSGPRPGREAWRGRGVDATRLERDAFCAAPRRRGPVVRPRRRRDSPRTRRFLRCSATTRTAVDGARAATRFAGLTTSDVPATRTKSARGRSFSRASKNDAGSEAPKRTCASAADDPRRAAGRREPLRFEPGGAPSWASACSRRISCTGCLWTASAPTRLDRRCP